MGLPTDVAIDVRSLGKDYAIGERGAAYGSLRDLITGAISRRPREASAKGTHTALDDVSFTVREGESVGFVGHNGAGKSTLLKVLSQITPPTRGTADIRGRIGALLEVGTGFHPELTGRENVYLNGAILGMTRREIALRYDEIVAFSGVERFLETPVKHYSTGMAVRLAFAVASHIDPEILFVDEVLAVGDAAFQRRCLERLSQLAAEGRTILFVSHNMSVIQGLCDRGIVLHAGRVGADGPIDVAIAHYLSTLEQAVSVPLTERQDRKGVGPCRIQSVAVSGPSGGPVVAGAPARIVVEIDPPDPSVTCAMSIHDPFGVVIGGVDSSNPGDGDGVGPDPNTYICEIDPLLLRPGRYRLDIGLQSGPRWHDALHPATFFDVEQGRLEGRPLLDGLDGSVLFPHRWVTPQVR